jgi:hypothetical protein
MPQRASQGRQSTEGDHVELFVQALGCNIRTRQVVKRSDKANAVTNPHKCEVFRIGFSGIVVSMLASGTQVRGFKPG